MELSSAIEFVEDGIHVPFAKHAGDDELEDEELDELDEFEDDEEDFDPDLEIDEEEFLDDEDDGDA
jgi:hypothetical protein